jgi:hypothetical protein
MVSVVAAIVVVMVGPLFPLFFTGGLYLCWHNLKLYYFFVSYHLSISFIFLISSSFGTGFAMKYLSPSLG